MSAIWNAGNQWDFSPDPLNIGIQEKWFEKIPAQTKAVNIPHLFAFEKERTTVGFYFKKFEVSKKESNRRFFIRFDSIAHLATIWLNGTEIGSHLGAHTTFDVDASQAVKIGEINFLVVRIEAPGPQGFLEDRHFTELPMGSLYKHVPYAGMLGNIHLLMAGRAGIQNLLAFPDYEADRVTLELRFWNPKNFKAELEFTLINPAGVKNTLPKQVKLEKENATYSITFSLDQAQAWTPESPQYYEVEVLLRGSYSVTSRFGLRRVEVERCQFKLNHDVRKIKGIVFGQPLPVYGILGPKPTSIRQQLEQIKDAGFNLVRTGGLPFDNETLSICDELGLMVIQESTCWSQKSNKTSLEELKDIIKSLILHTGSHPSLIAWGIGAQNGSMALEHGNKLLRFAAECDPYRPILSNLESVEMDSNGIGKIDLGKVYDPTGQKIDPYESHRLRLAIPLPIATQTLLGHYCSSKDAKAVNDHIHGNKSFWERYNYLKDELGGKILADALHAGTPAALFSALKKPELAKHSQDPHLRNASELEKQLQDVLSSISCWSGMDEFLEQAELLVQAGLVDHMEALLSNTQFMGYFYGQWADHGADYRGLVDLLREPKTMLKHLKDINSPLKILSLPESRLPYPGTSAAININLWNETELSEYNLLVRVKGPNGRIWHQESMSGKAKRGLNNLGRYKFPIGAEPGFFTFDLALSEGKKELVKKEESFFVCPSIQLEPYLKELRWEGSFPDTLSYASNPEASTILATRISQLPETHLEQLFHECEEGKNLVLCGLTPEDLDVLRRYQILGNSVRSWRGRWASLGSFHYATQHPVFEDLPGYNSLLTEPYSDLLPLWTFSPSPEMQVISGGIHIYDRELGAEKVHQGVNLAQRDWGKGKIWFCQFNLSENLGRSPLMDAFFANLMDDIHNRKKKSKKH